MKRTFVVIKVGSSLAVRNGKVHAALFHHLIPQLQELLKNGTGVCLVVSGAVCIGKHNPVPYSDSLSASVGQALLGGTLAVLFQEYGLLLSQLLVTKSDFMYKGRREHLRQLFAEGKKKNVVFFANENDAVDLHSFGGNDFLASEIAKLVQATHLLLLTDVDGVYGEDMEVIREYDVSLSIPVSTAFLKRSIGGIESKIQAALESAKTGIETFIASGREKDMIHRIIIENHHVGTRFVGGRL